MKHTELTEKLAIYDRRIWPCVLHQRHRLLHNLFIRLLLLLLLTLPLLLLHLLPPRVLHLSLSRDLAAHCTPLRFLLTSCTQDFPPEFLPFTEAEGCFEMYCVYLYILLCTGKKIRYKTSQEFVLLLVSKNCQKIFLSDPSPIIGNACHSLPNWLTDSCLVNLIDVTLACEDANSKLVEVVSVVDVDDKDRVGNSLLQI